MMTATAPCLDHAAREDVSMLTFVHPLLGFPDEVEYGLVEIEKGSPLSRLQAARTESVSFLVVPAAQFFPHYEPVVSDEVVADLGIESVQDVLVLLVVHAGADLASTTVNLRAPVLVNTSTLKAAQVILDDPELPVAAPLVGESGSSS